ncbi:MAG: hypothetical protein JWO86_8351 [Myxococcaceae bacterium]|nr:hypothetical protein [Myxococcaceae bacterium]
MTKPLWWGSVLWTTALAIVLAHATGCILAVPAFDHADHCAIGGTGACAACLRKSCQPTIDGCCGDPVCSGADGHSAVLDGLDACGAGDANGCAAGLAQASPNAGGAVRSCVTTSCKAECVGDAVATAPWSCGNQVGGATPCGSCVLEGCATQIAECCGDSSCKSDSEVVEDIGACIGGDSGKCVYRLTNETSDGIAGKIRSCMKKCQSCFGSGLPHEVCDYRNSGSSCSCSAAEKSSGPACPGTTVTGDCVLGSKGCTCGHYACNASSSSLGGCSCSFDGDLSGNSEQCNVARSPDTGGGICCFKFETTGPTCTCKTYSSTCYTDEREIASCDLADVKRAAASAFVTSCSN